MADIIQLIIQAKNEASASLRQVNADLRNLDKSVGTLNKIATLDLGLTGLQAALGTIQAIGQAVSEASQAGANLTRLDQGFDKLASNMGTNSDAIMQAIDSVTQGTLSQKTIMQQANNAMLLGVADTADEFSTLAKIALDRGRAMGISMEYAFESIVKGVGRLSPLILDNLGIVLDADKTYAQYAKTIGKVADDLTDAEKRAALISRLKEEVSDFDSSAVNDAGAAWERLAASTENATAAFGQWINTNTPLIAGLEGLAESLDILSSKFSDDAVVKLKAIGIEMKNLEEYAAQYTKDYKDSPFVTAMLFGGDKQAAFESGLKYTKSRLKELQQERDKIIGEMNQNSKELSFGQPKVNASIVNDLEKEYQQGAVAVEWYAKAMKISRAEAEQQIRAMIDLKGSWAAAAPAIAEAGNAAVIAAQKLAHANSVLSSTLSSIQGAALQAYVDTGFNPAIIESYRAVDAQVNALLPQMTQMDEVSATFFGRMVQEQAAAPFAAISEQARESEKAIGGAASKTKSLTAEFQNLSGIVGGIFSDAFSDIGGADLDKFLPYSDKPGEAARRIASVMVEGYDSEWAGYFQSEFPNLFTQYMAASGGDIQQAAAMLLKDYQDGLRPELIDKNKVKELAIRMFKADAETKKMVDELARELASELGISIEEAQSYASGAAGGGKKKTPMTPEEIKKLQETIANFTPKWDFGTAKVDFLAAGKKAGVLDESGNLLVNVKVAFGESPDLSSLATTNITISNFVFSDRTKFLSDLQEAAKISMKLMGVEFSETFDASYKQNVTDKLSPTVTIVPGAVDSERWYNYFVGIQEWINTNYLLYIDLVAKVSSENMAETLKPVKDEFMANFFDQDSINTLALNFTGMLGVGLLGEESVGSLKFSGQIVSTFMKAGFEASNLGESIASTLATQLTNAQKSFEASATNSGKVWGGAFLKIVQQNVPVELVNILTDLVAPEVQKKLQEGKERGGSVT